MAELSLVYPTTISQGGGNNTDPSVFRRVLVRTGDRLPANTIIDLNSPGIGWTSSGDLVTITGSLDFVDNVQVFRGGQLLLAGQDAAEDNDVYFASAPSSIAFEFPIFTNDVLQFWKLALGQSGGSGGLSAEEHELLDTLVHNISEDATVEITRNANNQVIGVSYKTSPGGTLIRSTSIIRDSGGKVIQTVETQYNGSGGVVQTLVTDITRTGNSVSSLNLTET